VTVVAATTQQQEGLGLSAATVLVVDDEPLLCSLVSRILRDAGYSTLEANHGRSALEAARRSGGRLSLVVSDVRMPVMDGVQFAREFRLLFPTVPILFTSGQADVSLAGEEVLAKPFKAELLLSAVTRLLSVRANGSRTCA
jgi:CheY-like chemotaxis protein